MIKEGKSDSTVKDAPHATTTFTKQTSGQDQSRDENASETKQGFLAMRFPRAPQAAGAQTGGTQTKKLERILATRWFGPNIFRLRSGGPSLDRGPLLSHKPQIIHLRSSGSLPEPLPEPPPEPGRTPQHVDSANRMAEYYPMRARIG